jgi:hypothetical protein
MPGMRCRESSSVLELREAEPVSLWLWGGRSSSTIGRAPRALLSRIMPTCAHMSVEPINPTRPAIRAIAYDSPASFPRTSHAAKYLLVLPRSRPNIRHAIPEVTFLPGKMHLSTTVYSVTGDNESAGTFRAIQTLHQFGPKRRGVVIVQGSGKRSVRLSSRLTARALYKG